MQNGCAADVWGLRGLAPVGALHTPHRADARFSLAPSRPRGICRHAPTERPHCAVKSLPCALKFRLRISTRSTAPLSFAGEPSKPLDGGGQPSRCERAERSGDHVRRRPQRDCFGRKPRLRSSSFAGEPSKPLDGGGQPSRCERAERSEDHVRRRSQRDCSGGTDLFGGACPCRSRGAQRCLLHRSDFGIRASQTPSPSRGAQRCLSQRGGDSLITGVYALMMAMCGDDDAARSGGGQPKERRELGVPT